MIVNQTIVSGPKGMKAGKKVTEADLQNFTTGQWRQIVVDHEQTMSDIEAMDRSHRLCAAGRPPAD